jgi:NTP pyrophosphatase (non-canonical NTP hydrolase)
MKTFEEYEAGAAKTCTMKGNNEDVLHAVFGAASEVGELADAMKRYLVYDKPIDSVNIMEEVGDVLWYLHKLAKTMGYTLTDAARANIAKLDNRSRQKRENIALRDLTAERQLLIDALNAS